MPNITRRQVRYVNDFGVAIDEFQFKIRQDKGGVISTYEDSTSTVCSGAGNLFKPRTIIAEYADRSTIRYPVPEPTIPSVRQTATEALADGAVCVHLDGESWSVVPNSILNDAPGNRIAYTIPDRAAIKEVGRFSYNSDVLGPIEARYSFEVEPLPISQAVLSCLGGAPEAGSFPCSLARVLTTRGLVVIANNVNGGQIVRKAATSSVGAEQRNCGENLLGVGYCVRYKGESARNLQILVPDINP
jgi:hypothetical protein